MDAILLDLILWASAFAAGWYIRGALILARLASDPDKMIKILESIRELNRREGSLQSSQPEDVSGDELRIERVGNELYAYTVKDDEFIAQGPDLTTVLELAHKRYPNRSFFGTIAATDPAKELATKN
jgi:hypothetical protein